jgi:hypothetical protein
MEEECRGRTASQAWTYLGRRIYYVLCKLAYVFMMQLVMLLMMAHLIMHCLLVCDSCDSFQVFFPDE